MRYRISPPMRTGWGCGLQATAGLLLLLLVGAVRQSTRAAEVRGADETSSARSGLLRAQGVGVPKSRKVASFQRRLAQTSARTRPEPLVKRHRHSALRDARAAGQLMEEFDPITEQEAFYDKYHQERGVGKCSGCRYLAHLNKYYKGTRSVLDAGAGKCQVVRKLQELGYDQVNGVELSGQSLKTFCPDLLEQRVVFQTGLDKLPFPDNHFDLVFSTEVLEHVPEAQIPAAVAELARVTKGPLFLTISLRRSKFDPSPPKQAKIHITVKTRGWWDKQFASVGCKRDNAVYSALQNRKVTENDIRGCVKKKPNGQECVKEGEHEPWFFPYQCS